MTKKEDKQKYTEAINSLSEKQKKILLLKVSDLEEAEKNPLAGSSPVAELTQEEIDQIFEKLTQSHTKNNIHAGPSKAKQPLANCHENLDSGLKFQPEIDSLLQKLHKIIDAGEGK